MKKEDKGLIISELTELLKQYPHFYITDIEALNAEKTSKLRRECFKQDIKLVVVKNTLLQKAMENVEGTDYSELYGVLKGNSAIMFTNTANLPARLIKEFTKDVKKDVIAKPQLKAAYVQECFYHAGDLEALATIKSKEELVGDIIMLLQSPAKRVISALQSNSGQKIHGILKTLEEKGAK
ncbi:MAG: 50S ribosomal protein L10 [Tannerella sp.]|jgi:large subunit ribosomal protein L10|nr:50S ribosomal protein L10 [Tannerella sp.]